MKIRQLSNNAIVVKEDTGVLTLFSYESEVLNYNPWRKSMTVYTNIANYSKTTKKHVRIFCDEILNDSEIASAIFDPKKNCKDYKILHIINEQFRHLNQVEMVNRGSIPLPPFAQQ